MLRVRRTQCSPAPHRREPRALNAFRVHMRKKRENRNKVGATSRKYPFAGRLNDHRLRNPPRLFDSLFTPLCVATKRSTFFLLNNVKLQIQSFVIAKAMLFKDFINRHESEYNFVETVFNRMRNEQSSAVNCNQA